MPRDEALWIATTPEQRAFPQLRGKEDAEVAVVGGGIVGITTALLLAEEGVDVVLLESDRLARGVSGHTTAKVTSQHGLIYARLRSRFGEEAAAEYGSANEEALAWMAQRVERDGIDCDFRRQPAFVYAAEAGNRSKIEAEVEAATAAGLPASLVETTPLPYPVEAAVRFENQAEFHVRRYLLALSERLSALGCRIFEQSRVDAVHAGGRLEARTAEGAVHADRLIVATHYPFLDRSLAFARVHPERSYALVCRIEGEPTSGMHINADSPSRSVRSVPLDGDRGLLIGGEGHKTGEGGDTEERYRRLSEFAAANWTVTSVDYRWSTQDNATIDGLPYVGRLTPRSDRILMATGFAKWGMTGGTAAALLLADLAAGRDNAFAGLYDPNRIPPPVAAVKFAKENTRVAAHLVGDRLRTPMTRQIDDLSPGEAGVVWKGLGKMAAYRREDGSLLAVSSRCTHLGCQLDWNPAERSWDCPCHGSRFDPEGRVLHGPAVRDLERKSV